MERFLLDKKLLSTAEGRNISIPEMIASGAVYMPPVPEKTERMRRIVDFYTHRLQDVKGVENLVKAVKLSEHSKLTVTSNHQTDLDHAGKRFIFESLGFGEFADRLVYSGGLKMKERWYIVIFMGAEHTVFIATPKDLNEVQTVLSKDKKNHFLKDSQRPLLETYQRNLEDLNKAAFACLNNLVIKD